jgi:hypothetical protein
VIKTLREGQLRTRLLKHHPTVNSVQLTTHLEPPFSSHISILVSILHYCKGILGSRILILFFPAHIRDSVLNSALPAFARKREDLKIQRLEGAAPDMRP